MHDLKNLINNREKIEKNLQKRDKSISLDNVVDLSEKRNTLISQYEKTRRQLNEANRKMSQIPKNSSEFTEYRKKLKEIGTESSRLKGLSEAVETELRREMLNLPNIISDNVPVSQVKTDSIIERTYGAIPEYSFEPKDHVELCESLGTVDFKNGAKIAKAGFPLYSGKGAQLEWSLINYFIDKATDAGFKFMLFPLLNNTISLTSSGNLPKFAAEIYSCEQDGLHAIPTAEVPLTNLFRGEIIEDDLPVKLASYSPCFRREAGAGGTANRGLMRMHQFNKVETYIFCKPEDSNQELEGLIQHGEGILQDLGLHYRLANLPSCDLAHQSSQTKDIEIYIPSLGKYSEVSSASNCLDFQTRRANIRFKDGNKKEYAHSLNCSALATPRVTVALLETYQNANGSISVPEVLQKYTGFDRIEPK